MTLEPVNIIHALIIWQSFLFAAVLLTPKFRKKKSNKYLALILVTIGVHFVYNILYTNAYYLDILPAFSCSYGYLYGPLLFLHIKFYLIKDVSFKPIDWIHFLPFVFIIISTSLGFSFCRILGVWILPVMLVYCLFAYREIIIYKKTLTQVSSQSYDSQTRWLRLMLLIMAIIVVLNVIQSQVNTLYIGGIKVSMEVIVQIGILFLVNVITYQGLKTSHFFQQVSASDIAMSKQHKGNKSTTHIDINALQDLAQQLENHMQKKKPYLNPDLNIKTLAEAMGIPPKTLSQTINHALGSNFSDYINSYRIREAKASLEQQHENALSIKEIMYAVGFNSRSVFNTVFKKKTGQTPSEYRKHYQ
ncbi:MAG: helix-turn-helix domain-containing protein [Chitinophagales bacterium]|nr:helix-turn-helix domain-containing protein [Chitinophagales bacterium]